MKTPISESDRPSRLDPILIGGLLALAIAAIQYQAVLRGWVGGEPIEALPPRLRLGIWIGLASAPMLFLVRAGLSAVAIVLVARWTELDVRARAAFVIAGWAEVVRLSVAGVLDLCRMMGWFESVLPIREQIVTLYLGQGIAGVARQTAFSIESVLWAATLVLGMVLIARWKRGSAILLTVLVSSVTVLISQVASAVWVSQRFL